MKHNEISCFLKKQIQTFWTITSNEELIINKHIEPAINSMLSLSKSVNNKYFSNDKGEPKFSTLHSDQYAMFLYLISKFIYKLNTELGEKIYYLNKVMHSIDVYPAVQLPEKFCFFHPLGTILGRAEYNDYFTVSQACTVGNNKGIYPKIGKYVSLYANSMILGDSTIGNNCIISAGTIVKDQDIPDNSIVFGISPNITIKENKTKGYVWKKQLK